MRIVKYIWLFGLFLLYGLNPARAQSDWSVCVGDTGVIYSVTGWENSTFEWTVEGGTISRHMGASIAVDWGDEPGLFEITVREISEHGCAGALQRGQVEVIAPDVELGRDQYVCDGDVMEFSPGDEYYSYLWHDGSTGTSLITGEEGWVTVEVSDQYGCRASDSVYLDVMELPFVDLGPDTTICGGEGYELDAGNDGISYLWSTGEETRYITVFTSTVLQVWAQVEDEFMCVGGDTVVVRGCDPRFWFRDIPSAITPGNLDGVNDTWRINKLEPYTQAVVEIFDRWGTLVWRSEPGYPEPWDGHDLKGRLVPSESYHFVIQLNTGERKDVVTGLITVIR